MRAVNLGTPGFTALGQFLVLVPGVLVHGFRLVSGRPFKATECAFILYIKLTCPWEPFLATNLEQLLLWKHQHKDIVFSGFGSSVKQLLN